MITLLVMNLLNAAGNYVVVFRPFETPFTGVEGVAIMRAASEIIALLIMIFFISQLNLGMDFRNLFPFPCDILKDILRIGVPSGIQSLSYNLSQIVTTTILAILGAVAISAKIYVQNINIFVFVTGQSLGQAAAILVGRYVGAKDWDCTAAGLLLRWMNVSVDVF